MAALVVGKAVEEVHRAGITQVVLHRHRGRLQVERVDALLDGRIVGPRVALELRVQCDLGDVLEPVGKGFVQPDVVPPVQRDEVAKPLVRQFMRHNNERACLAHRVDGRRCAIGRHQHLVGKFEDGAPVLHPAKAGILVVVAVVGDDGVHLVERQRDLEVVVVVVQRFLGELHAGDRRVRLAGRHPPAQAHAAAVERVGELVFQDVELATAEEQQVRRHRRCLGKRHLLIAVRQLGGTRLPAVGHGLPVARNFRRHLEGVAEGRFIPAREPLAREVRFALRDDGVRTLTRCRLQAQLEDALGLGEVDRARPLHVEHIVAGLDVSDGVAQVVEGALRLWNRHQHARCTAARGGRECQARGVELQVAHGQRHGAGLLGDLDLHVGAAREAVQVCARAEPQLVVDRPDVVRQFHRRHRCVDCRRWCIRVAGIGIALLLRAVCVQLAAGRRERVISAAAARGQNQRGRSLCHECQLERATCPGVGGPSGVCRGRTTVGCRIPHCISPEVETNRRPEVQNKNIRGRAAESRQGIPRLLRGANHSPRTGWTDSGGNGR